MFGGLDCSQRLGVSKKPHCDDRAKVQVVEITRSDNFRDVKLFDTRRIARGGMV